MALADTGALILGPLQQIGESVLDALPGLAAAILILILGYLIGAFFGIVVKQILEKTKIISSTIKKIGLQTEIGKWNLNGFFGLITKWYIFIVFLNPAAQVVRLDGLSEFFGSVALWVPNIILAVIISLAGYVLSEYIAKKIKDIKGKKVSMLAGIAKVTTMIFVILIALRQIGVEVSVAENTFLIILGGIMLGVSIAFGFAFKDEAKSIIKDVKKQL